MAADTFAILRCFNCATTDGVQFRTIDPDLPGLNSCSVCWFGLFTDWDLPRSLKRREASAERAPREGTG